MRKIGIFAALGLAVAGSAHAGTAPTACTNFNDFFMTNCPMTWNGITFYGTVDMGVGYESHGAPFNPNFPTGVGEFLQKFSNKSTWTKTPNGLSQSVVGLRGDEPIAPGASFVFDIEAGFDPYSLQIANGLKSQVQNDYQALGRQSTNGDTSRAGQWDNSQGYAGLKTDEYGTLLVGRVNSLTLDGVNAYDPMGGSYAFSPIGWSGTTPGAGNTEDARANTAAKYRVNVGPIRAAALVQAGGYELGNGAKNAYSAQLGGDVPTGGYGQLSLDGIFTKLVDAVSLSTLSGAVVPANYGTLKATLSDNTSLMLLARYTIAGIKFSGGYEHILFQNPSDTHITGFNTIGGYPVSSVSVNSYGSATVGNKTLHVFWGGAKYAVLDNVDVAVAYYHYLQESYYHIHCSTAWQSSCSGTMDAASAMVDWRILPKLDAYAGVMFSEVNGGLQNGYLYHSSIDPTAGVRFKF